MPTIEIPSFNWSAFYYPQILEALIQFKRINVPELTEESPQEPLIQMLRAFALVGHLNNTLLDLVANENTLPTAKLPETIRNMLRLIDYRLSSASPSVVDILYKLTQTLSASTALISANSQVSTVRTLTEDEIVFEVLTALTVVNDTSLVQGVYSYDDSEFTITDNTTAAQSASGSTFNAWGTTPQAGDYLYIGHTDIMFDHVRINLTTLGHGIVGFWEYYDGNWQDGKPDEVADQVGYLRFYLSPASSDPSLNQTGRICRVRVDATGAYENCVVAWTAAQDSPGRNYIETADYLGQTSPSVDEDDYTIGYDWNEIQNITDGSVNLTGETNNQDPDGETDNQEPDWIAQIGGPALQSAINGLLGVTDQSGTDVKIRLNSSGEYEDCVSLWGDLGSGDVNYIETTGTLGQGGTPSETASDYEVAKIIPVSQIAGPALRAVINGLLGTSDESGTDVRIRLDSSYAYEDCVSLWGDLGDGNVNYIETTGTLGQGGSPSETASDYEVAELVDDVVITFPIPQTLTDNWIKTPYAPVGYWIRFRITRVNNPITPVIEQVRINGGNQYVLAVATQGETQNDANLGISDGTADQEFVTTKDGFIDESATVTVNSVEWTKVDDFLDSSASSQHYAIQLGENDRATIVFGDGITGAIPDSGANISAVYRYSVDNDGNVGAGTIIDDRTGLNYIAEIINPRDAVGWQASESSSEESLELAKILGPASLRIKDVAIGPDDIVLLAKQWVDENTDTRPVSRGFAIEGSYGPKTIELVVVIAGGGDPASGLLDSLEEYFNGDKYSSPPKEKHLVANQELVATNYIQKVIDVEIEVSGDAVSQTALETHFNRLLQPEALKTDGISYEWNFGSPVYKSRITHEVFEANAGVDAVTVITPATDVTLNPRELPILGELIITEA
jgi:hypothetical protein